MGTGRLAGLGAGGSIKFPGQLYGAPRLVANTVVDRLSSGGQKSRQGWLRGADLSQFSLPTSGSFLLFDSATPISIWPVCMRACMRLQLSSFYNNMVVLD